MAALMTAKQVVSQASLEVGITLKPISSLTATKDQDIIQMAALLSSVADDILLEEPYRVTLGDGVWLLDSNGQPKVPPPITDDDLILFDGRLAINGLKFKFLAAKGLEFGEQMRDYSTRLNKLAGMVNGRVIDLDVDAGRVL